MNDYNETKYVKKSQKKKKYGIQYKYLDSFFEWMNQWSNYRWYETEGQRDQAFNNLTRKSSPYIIRDWRKIERE